MEGIRAGNKFNTYGDAEEDDDVEEEEENVDIVLVLDEDEDGRIDTEVIDDILDTIIKKTNNNDDNVNDDCSECILTNYESFNNKDRYKL